MTSIQVVWGNVDFPRPYNPKKRKKSSWRNMLQHVIYFNLTFFGNTEKSRWWIIMKVGHATQKKSRIILSPKSKSNFDVFKVSEKLIFGSRCAPRVMFWIANSCNLLSNLLDTRDSCHVSKSWPLDACQSIPLFRK